MTEPAAPASGEAPRRRRMTQAELVERLLARGGTEHSSVELRDTAKGDVLITVTVRTGDTAGVTTIEEAELVAAGAYDRLRARYPFTPEPGSSSSRSTIVAPAREAGGIAKPKGAKP